MSSRRWEDNIRTAFKVIGDNTRNLIDLAQDRLSRLALVNVKVNLRVS